MYLFLSDQGNCYYMASNDPRYAIVRSPQTGQVTETIKRKLQSTASANFQRFYISLAASDFCLSTLPAPATVGSRRRFEIRGGY